MLPSAPIMLNLRRLLLFWTILIGQGLFTAPPVLAVPTTEPLSIVVTIPVLKDLAEQVGGPYVRVTSLLSGYENEHTYSPKPSDLVAVRKARVLFEVGIGLEVWVSSLVKNAGSSSLRVVTTSKGIALLRDESGHEGTSHAGGEEEQGNPHVWMDPENAMTMMRHITEALIQADPAHATEFRSNQASYLRKLDQLRVKLSERIARLADRRFVAHHPAWPYFARRFGFDVAATIQMQSGSEPSALQLQTLIGKIKKDRIKVIVSEIQLSQKLPDLLAKETKTKVIVLTTLPGGLPGTETYLDMLRYNVLQLANALESP
ncbi:MAG: zinc ABC transporter substrate-binding protein [Nitrospira sp.]|nr:MAG: zinc ABC transporter substrate-binding protein [Nitrospira sp.]